MKIDVSGIIVDHIHTLCDTNSKKLLISDFILFYMLPTLIAIAVLYYKPFLLTKDAYSVSITFFGIFIALLLNMQVAVYGIFQRKWSPPDDARQAELQKDDLIVRTLLLGEINSNISYLILIACLALIVFLVFFVVDANGSITAAVAVILYSHFLLTLLMIVRRAHALFQREYANR